MKFLERTMATVQAKGKVRARHERAISLYLDWSVKHPKASRRERVKKFDLYIDTVALVEKEKVK